jgi:hypothetical protein
MELHARTWSTAKQNTELWECWKRGQCAADTHRPSKDCTCAGTGRFGRQIALEAGLLIKYACGSASDLRSVARAASRRASSTRPNLISCRENCSKSQ